MDQLTMNQKLFILSKTYESTSQYFSHWEDALFKREELDDVYRTFLSRVLETENRCDFTFLMFEFFGLLRNAHSRYVDRTFNQLYPYTPLGIAFDHVDDQWTVRRSDVDAVKVGDVIVSVQGKTLDEWEAEIGKYNNAVKETSRKIMLRNGIPAHIEDAMIDVILYDRSDQQRHVTFERVSNENEQITTTGNWKDKDTAYIHIPSFTEPRFEHRAIELVQAFRNANCLIIDLRGNNGGSTPSELTQSLMNVPWQWWTERSINPYFLYNRHAPTGSKIFTAKDYSYAEAVPRLVQPTNDPYQGKVIILANRFSASAAEDFIMAFKDTHRGVIIGESTWGSTGMQYRYDFGNGINIHIGTIRSYFPDGAPFEGVGIEPDIPVNFTRDDYYKDRDPVLLKALDMARTFSRSSAIR